MRIPMKMIQNPIQFQFKFVIYFKNKQDWDTRAKHKYKYLLYKKDTNLILSA